MPIALNAACVVVMALAAWSGPGLGGGVPPRGPAAQHRGLLDLVRHWPAGIAAPVAGRAGVVAAEGPPDAPEDRAEPEGSPRAAGRAAEAGDDDWSIDAVFVDAEDRLWVAIDDGAGYILHRFPWEASRVRTAAAVIAALLLGIATWRVYRGLRRRARMRRIEARRRRAEEASRAKSDFLATLGHEVRTPMTGLLGMCELLQSTTLDDRQRDYVDSIDRAGRHLVRLLDDAMDVASIEAGRLAITAAPFDPRVLARELSTASEPLAACKGLRFACEVDPTTPRDFHGDAVRVRQVLLNLVSNAIKFTPSGSVRVELSDAGGGGLQVRVSDTGPGLDARQRSRLFSRFVQVGPQGRGDRRGRGLGLAISRELVEAMGGTISVESVPGRGSCFAVVLPPLPAATPHGPVAASGVSRTPLGAMQAAPGTAA